MNSKLVSVIIPTYSRPDGLKRSIDSVLNQTYENIELIIVDDNDPETRDRKLTEKLMDNYKMESNIKYVKHSKNKNGAVARNTGIKHSKGEYVAFLDDDDEFLERKIELQVQMLESLASSYGVVYTKFIRKKNNKLIEKGIENRTGDLSLEILKGNFYISGGSNILLKRSVLEKIKGFNESFLRRQDLEFLIRASLVTKVAHVDEVCLVIHKDDNSNIITGNKLEENTKLYLDVFEQYINSVSKLDREKIIVSQKLLELRPYIYKGKLLTIKRFADKEGIKYNIVIKYIFYLVKRKIFKQCYGFLF